MGLILSRFRKKKSTKEVLEEIQKKIEDIEEYKEHTEQQRKWLVGSLVVYSIVLYLISAVVVYIYYMPTQLNDILICAAPFAVFPFLVYFLKNVLTWYYHRKVTNNERRLKELRVEKNKILDQVMETETYKVAKEIMETYAPDQLRQSLLGKTPSGSPSQVLPQPRFATPASASTGSEVRRRIIPSPSGPIARPPVTPSYGMRPNTPVAFRPVVATGLSVGPKGGNTNINNPRSLPISNTPVSVSSSATYGSCPPPIMPRASAEGPAPGPPMPRPVLPRERGVLDRFIEYLVGDGPANRYALVCRQCESHNGMALKEEFEYIAFRCAYCYYWNPARKQRPMAPRLETLNPRPVPPPIPSEQEGEDDEDEEEETSSSCEDSSSKEEDSSSTSDTSSSNSEGLDDDQVTPPDSTSESSCSKALFSQGSHEDDLVSTTSTSDEFIKQPVSSSSASPDNLSPITTEDVKQPVLE